jgi:MoxR-like ATPase
LLPARSLDVHHRALHLRTGLSKVGVPGSDVGLHKQDAKAQAALLEAMEERQVTIAGTTHKRCVQGGARRTNVRNVEKYIVAIIAASRRPGDYDGDLAKWIKIGASPRGTLALDRAARARAWLEARDTATPDDVKAVAHGCLRHRLILSYEAEAEGITKDAVWMKS